MRTTALHLLAAVLLGATGCAPPLVEAGDTDTDTDTDTAEGLPWGEGERVVSGRAYFFDVQDMAITWQQDVEGASVYVLEAPELEVQLDPASEHVFSLSGIPEGAELTLALVHPDYFPSLTATWPVGEEDLDGLTFQALSLTAATLAGAMVGTDVRDETRCHMATTVTAEGGDDIWAPGEPGSTVSLEPAVPAEQGPFYFNPSVMPDPDLSETTTDGGVMVAGAEPGVYTWRGSKEGFAVDELRMPCVAGWLTNAAPPRSMFAHPVR